MGFVVFAGQSNMGGAGRLDLPASWKPDPQTFIWNEQAHGWEQMHPGGNAGCGAFAQTWGPDCTAATATTRCPAAAATPP